MTSTTSPPPDRPFRVGMIGAGGIAHGHLPAWLELGADVRIFSLEGAPEISAAIGGIAVDSLAEAFTDVDAVDVCTPTPTHAEIVTAALDAGIVHVVCEKPLGRTSAQARTMINAAAAAGAQLYPGHVVRFFDEFATMHAAVADGAVGTVAVQRFSRTGSAPDRAWFHDDEQSGGIVLDQMIHDLDFARWTAGEVASVFARERSGAQDPTGNPIRSAQVVLTHTGGAISYVTGTWAPAGTPFRTTFEITGTGGLLSHDSTRNSTLRLVGGPASTAGTGLLPDLGAVSPFFVELGEYLAAFNGGPPPRVSASDGLAAIVIAEAAIESIRTGQAVRLAETSSTQEVAS